MKLNSLFLFLAHNRTIKYSFLPVLVLWNKLIAVIKRIVTDRPLKRPQMAESGHHKKCMKRLSRHGVSSAPKFLFVHCSLVQTVSDPMALFNYFSIASCSVRDSFSASLSNPLAPIGSATMHKLHMIGRS